jgi:hypothetical protein
VSHKFHIASRNGLAKIWSLHPSVRIVCSGVSLVFINVQPEEKYFHILLGSVSLVVSGELQVENRRHGASAR